MSVFTIKIVLAKLLRTMSKNLWCSFSFFEGENDKEKTAFHCLYPRRLFPKHKRRPKSLSAQISSQKIILIRCEKAALCVSILNGDRNDFLVKLVFVNYSTCQHLAKNWVGLIHSVHLSWIGLSSAFASHEEEENRSKSNSTYQSEEDGKEGN